MANEIPIDSKLPNCPDTGPCDQSEIVEGGVSHVASTVEDIEHNPVQDDPRQWSPTRKNLSLFLVASATMICGLAGSIQNPAVEEMEADLPATSQQFSLSLSLFILVQGSVPLLWTAISEVKGRKLVYLVSLALFTNASIVVALSTNIGLVIAFRAIQAAGSSAIMSIGAATLADIFEPAERGTKMGIYYMAPLLGSSLGPIAGGVLTAGLGWRSIFWFLTIFSGISWLAFIFLFRDTFRKQRSLTYQNVLKQHLESRRCSGHINAGSPISTTPTTTSDFHHGDLEKDNKEHPAVSMEQLEIELSLKDVNPFKPIGLVVRRINNLAILFASGLMYALTYMLNYTTARTLSNVYHYQPLMIGAVTISYGIGCVFGSLLGGIWSDRKLAHLKAENGGNSYPEMRLKSTILGLILLPPCIIGYGWVCERQTHIAAPCAFLFVSGFLTIWMYASTLAYIVDANTGRSATAVATNSAFRGFFAFIATEIAVPMQDNIKDGWLYTFWGFIMAISSVLILLVMWKGKEWRERAEDRESKVVS